MKRKIISAILISSLLISVAACDSQSGKQSDPTTSKADGQFETESQMVPDMSEPNQSIAESNNTTEAESSETTAAVSGGYEAYGYHFPMDINLEDYIFASAVDGSPCLNLYKMAEDYGWRPHRVNGDYSYGNDPSVDWYEYDFGDGNIMLFFIAPEGSRSNPLGRSQVNMICYDFAEYPIPYDVHSGTKCYDYDTQNNPQFRSSIISVPNHSSDTDWLSLYGGPQNGALTREDAIIVAYMITVGPQHPGENPFYYSDFIDSGYDTPTSGEYKLPY